MKKRHTGKSRKEVILERVIIVLLGVNLLLGVLDGQSSGKKELVAEDPENEKAELLNSPYTIK